MENGMMAARMAAADGRRLLRDGETVKHYGFAPAPDGSKRVQMMVSERVKVAGGATQPVPGSRKWLPMFWPNTGAGAKAAAAESLRLNIEAAPRLDS